MSSNQSNPPTLVKVPNDLLLNMLNIINMVTTRGAFRAPELKGVGIIWEQLSSITQKVQEEISPEQSSESNEPVKNV